MKARTTSLAVSGGMLVALVAVAAWLPVPYLLLSPGPTFDTLGEFDGQELLTIEGAETFPTSGRLDITTVSESGGPFGDITLLQALQGWWDSSIAVLPERLFYPEDVDTEAVEEENTAAFVDSQSAATAAALSFLDEPIRDVVVVSGVDEDGAAHDVLEPGDVVVTIDGTAPASSSQAAELIGARSPGDEIVFVIEREGRRASKTVTAGSADDDSDRAVVGITVSQTVQGEDVTVSYGLNDVGGPSAGLVFALAIIDQLSPESLADGRIIAGTGTINAEGQVGPIGGVQQKVVGAKRDGADYFLTPTMNCRDAAASAPEGLLLIRVDTLEEAVTALERLAAGQQVPVC